MKVKRWLIVAGALIVALPLSVIIVGTCMMSVSEFQMFTFPPDSRLDEDNWEYVGEVNSLTKAEGSLFNRTLKQVSIRVWDRSDSLLLDDNYDLNCGSVDANITWDTFDLLEVELLETVKEYVGDPNNPKLMELGPQRLLELKYRYNQDTKKFLRVD